MGEVVGVIWVTDAFATEQAPKTAKAATDNFNFMCFTFVMMLSLPKLHGVGF